MAVTFALVMDKQIDYLKTKDVGFDMDNVLVVPFYEPNAGNAITSFKRDVLKHHSVLSATTSTQSPGSVLGIETVWVETTTGRQAKQIKVLYAGDHYLETLRIPFKAGRDLPPASNVQAASSFLVNEAAVEFLGWDDEVLGKTMQFTYAEKPGSIVGVVHDFHFESMFTRIEPIIIVRSEEGARLHLKIHPEDVTNTIRFIRDKWSAYDFRFPLEYYFLDEYYNRQYLPHTKQYRLISILSGLSILIALLGLFGLSAFSAVERMREMGIRRVHGATGKGVTWLLYKEAAGMVLVSSLIIAPISYLVIENWLSNFPYPVPIDIWIFILVIASALMLTFGIVLFNAMKICRQRAVEVLKY
jgi:putative ABC transport system permease protein